MKIVLDTNVLVSGLLKSEGNPARVVTLVLSGAIQACYDKRILAEYAEVLARPRFKFDARRVREVLNKIETDGLATEAGGEANFDLPDPDDEPFLAVALAGSAEFLVTGNLSDYPPGKCRGSAVVSPATFMAHWRKLHGES
jgi:putative PIN family toxin of toxin-antitoxin system